MAKAREIPGLAPGTRFGDAAAAAVEVRTAEVFEHSEGVLDTGDIEHVHAMRVATRRLRAALELFAVCFPRKAHRKAVRDVKALADALGERRDPDVAIAALRKLERALHDADRPGLERLVAELQAAQRSGNSELAEALRAVEDSGLRGRLARLAAAARSVPDPALGDDDE